MDVTKPYKCILFWAIDVTKPYKFIGFGPGGTLYLQRACRPAGPRTGRPSGAGVVTFGRFEVGCAPEASTSRDDEV